MTLKREEISDKAEKAISDCADEDFSFMDVNWLSREFDVSPPNLSRAFKYEKGETLQDFMIKIRIMRSLILILKHSDLTTREIAKRVDYSYSHFIQAFKKRVGITPGKFRSQCAAGWPGATSVKRSKRPRDAGKNKSASTKKTKPKESQ